MVMIYIKLSKKATMCYDYPADKVRCHVHRFYSNNSYVAERRFCCHRVTPGSWVCHLTTVVFTLKLGLRGWWYKITMVFNHWLECYWIKLTKTSIKKFSLSHKFQFYITYQVMNNNFRNINLCKVNLKNKVFFSLYNSTLISLFYTSD